MYKYSLVFYNLPDIHIYIYLNNKSTKHLSLFYIFQMPTIVVERTTLPNEMRDALKRHILRERQKKKEEADANEADKQRRREEKAKALSSSKVKLEDTAKDIFKLERTIADLQQQKAEQYKLLKQALTEEDRRKHSQQTLSKEPSWTSLYPTSNKNSKQKQKTNLFLSI